jgi:hypothetical protein
LFFLGWRRARELLAKAPAAYSHAASTARRA